MTEKRKGRGVPKYFIKEDELNKYLKEIESNKKNKINLPGEAAPPKELGSSKSEALKKVMDQLVTQKEEVIEKQADAIKSLTKRVQMLEAVKAENHVTLNQQADEEQKARSAERRELILELANISVFAYKRKSKILKELNRLS